MSSQVDSRISRESNKCWIVEGSQFVSVLHMNQQRSSIVENDEESVLSTSNSKNKGGFVLICWICT